MIIVLLSFLWIEKEMGIDISDVNPDHLPEDVRAGRTKKRKPKIDFFIKCSIDASTKDKLFNKLKKQYGAIDIGSYVGTIVVIIIID